MKEKNHNRDLKKPDMFKQEKRRHNPGFTPLEIPTEAGSSRKVNPVTTGLRPWHWGTLLHMSDHSSASSHSWHSGNGVNKVLKRRKFLTGFTLIELLVVIAIIGLLASIVMTAMNNARLKARDAARLSNIQQIKTGMDLYFSHGSGYVSKTDWDALAASGAQLMCGTDPILKIPKDPLNSGVYTYIYETSGATVSGCGLANLSLHYTVKFHLEKDNGAQEYVINEDGQFSPQLP